LDIVPYAIETTLLSAYAPMLTSQQCMKGIGHEGTQMARAHRDGALLSMVSAADDRRDRGSIGTGGNGNMINFRRYHKDAALLTELGDRAWFYCLLADYV
jgi:hypothetical protein